MRLRTGLSYLLPSAALSLSSDPVSECSQKALLLSLSGLVEAKQGGRGWEDSGIPPGVLWASGLSCFLGHTGL